MSKSSKPAPVALALHVHAERMTYDSKCVMFTCSFFRKDRDADTAYYSENAVPTKLGAIRMNGLGFVIFASSERPGTAIDHSLEIEYRDIYRVKAHDAKAIVTTLGKLDRALEKLRTRLGYAESFTARLRRLCDVLGVEQIEFSRQAGDYAGTEHWNRDENGRVRVDVETGARWFVRAIEKADGSDQASTSSTAVAS